MKNALTLTRQIVALAGFASVAAIGAVGAVKNADGLLKTVISSIKK